MKKESFRTTNQIETYCDWVKYDGLKSGYAEDTRAIFGEIFKNFNFLLQNWFLSQQLTVR